MNDEFSTASTALLRGRNNNATKCVLFFGGNHYKVNGLEDKEKQNTESFARRIIPYIKST